MIELHEGASLTTAAGLYALNQIISFISCPVLNYCGNTYYMLSFLSLC